MRHWVVILDMFVQEVAKVLAGDSGVYAWHAS